MTLFLALSQRYIASTTRPKKNQQAFALSGKCVHRGGGFKGRTWRLWAYLIAENIFVFNLDGAGLVQTIVFLAEPLCFSTLLIGLQMVCDCSLHFILFDAVLPFFLCSREWSTFFLRHLRYWWLFTSDAVSCQTIRSPWLASLDWSFIACPSHWPRPPNLYSQVGLTIFTQSYSFRVLNRTHSYFIALNALSRWQKPINWLRSYANLR